MREKESKRTSLKKFFLGVAIFVAIMAALAGIENILKSCDEPEVLKPFKPYVDEYLNIPGLTSAPSEGDEYIVGKVITVDISAKKIDPIYLDLPDDIVSASPEEVGTIIWLRWEDVYVGRYQPGGDAAYKITCDVTLIDKLKAVVIGVKTFSGSEPPIVKSGPGPSHGSKPTNEIVDYLKSLPRR